MSGERIELLQGTLDLIVLRALATMGPLHAYSLAARLEQVSAHPFTLNQGTLYPALVRLEQKGWIKGTWQKTEHNRDAKYYGITKTTDPLLQTIAACRYIEDRYGTPRKALAFHLVAREDIPAFVAERRAAGVAIDVKLLIFMNF